MARKGRGGHRGLAGVLSSAGAGVAGLIAGIVLLPVIISTVSAEQYGIWLVVSAIAQYLNYSDLGVGTAIVHFGSRARAGGEERDLGAFLQAGLIWNTLALVVVAPVFMVVAYLYLWSGKAQDVLTQPESVTLLLVGVAMLGALLLKPFGSALNGAGLLPIERRNQAIGVLVRVVLTLVACLVLRDIVFVAMAEAIAVIVPVCLSWATVRTRKLAQMKWAGFPGGTLRYMLSYSVRSFAVNAVGALLLQAGTIAAGITLRPQDVTYYNAAFRVYTSVRQLIGWANDPFRPALSRLNVAAPAEARRALLSICFVTLSLSVAGCAVLIIAAQDVVRIWLGPGVPIDTIAVTMVLLLAGLMVNAIHLPLIPAADASGAPGVFFIPQLIWMVLTVGGSLLFGALLGLPGIALGLTLPLIVIEPFYLFRAARVLRFTLRDWSSAVARPVLLLAAGGGAAVGVWLLVAMASDLRGSGILNAVAFLVGSGATAVLLRKVLPWRSFVTMGKLEL
ncbi:lipopolysaccharide biosynthesis protein [Curtobacterium herbarum]|uniref:Oligosaccharide flippase family protein n=1 Tax=Curtobacterium herbarum TaxID=150122 RepID=A0ABP4JZS5_9MICO|nr:oligosaccharide flippase family protein [Curtobacterium herbarum]MBM7476526.1 O-antigen/teichoic acid export membrane protein [Curtobacterium herbarum]MCS6543912.1 oligosaccharide flippase family protein [Curtobacterium herbarum]